ncbi:hypothetical protein ID866_7993 [Astraeus odoratus]|nr:hypothetical protein ID866_7993 [Astraeus odoratus]
MRDNLVSVQKEHGYYCTSLVTSSRSKFNLAIDTGSAYTWVGAIEQNPYVEGFASRATGITTEATYAGKTITFKGKTYNDTVELGDLVIQSQGIGVASEVTGFPTGVDGILGLGPTVLTTGIGSDRRLIPTVLDNLYSQGIISSPIVGIYLVPENVGVGGLLSFGDIYGSVLTSDVKYVPVTKTYPAKYYWGVDASIMYGDNTPILNFGCGVLDTGSARIVITSDAFSAYQMATGGSLSSGRLLVTQDQYNKLQSLSIRIGDQSYHLSPNAQIQARPSANSGIFLVVYGSNFSSGMAFSLGAPFLYVISQVLRFPNQISPGHIYTNSNTN